MVVLVSIPGMMMFDWLYWWAGRRGANARSTSSSATTRRRRSARAARAAHARFGWVAIIIAYFQPVPNVLDVRRRGLDADAVRMFLILDAIG